MNGWLERYRSTRPHPRLWVERLWLLESSDPLELVRTVELRPGVNVVWAREPQTDAASPLASAGHGVGKTSFCLLLRYCLGDDTPLIVEIREKAAAHFPRGAVAAKVHLDGTTWIVNRPYGFQAQPRGGRGNALDALLAGKLDGSLAELQEGLHNAFIGKLPETTLPGTNQALEWRHLTRHQRHDGRPRIRVQNIRLDDDRRPGPDVIPRGRDGDDIAAPPHSV